jgi:superfamily II DNA or RNA helicase
MNKQEEVQEEAIETALEFFKKDNKGYIDAAMRFGKIRVALEILKRLFPNHTPSILITYPDNKIRASWEEDMVKWDYYNSNVTFVNFKSLHKYKDTFFEFFIIDEFHDTSYLQRDYCHQIMTNGTTYTLALSGTVSKETQRLWGIPCIYKYTTLDGIDDNVLANYQITVHKAKLDNKVKTPNSKGKLLTEKQKYDNYTYVINKFKKEGKDTMHLLLSRNRLSIASLGKMNKLKEITKTLQDKRLVVFAGLVKVADATGLPTYHNESKDSNFERFQSEEINHLCLAQMGKMGVSFVKLDCVILMNATSNAEDTAQICNRAIKLDYQGKVADIHIICLNEDAELAKIKRTLDMLDKTKIKYV